jgi:MFS family permease
MAQEQGSEYGFTKKQVTIGLVAIFAVYGTMSYFVQTLNIARPKMAADLNGLSLFSWAVSIPSLISAFVTLLFGKLSDVYGRRIMLMVSLVFCLTGTILSAISPNFIFLIAATVVSAFGTGSMMPLVFAVVGDLFPPSQRSKWIGLLNAPTGFFSLIGPTLGGLFVDHLSWRHLYWLSLPLLAVCLITVPIGVPNIINSNAKRKIDVLGCILVAIASSSMVIGLSFAGDRYPWGSPQIIGLLGTSLLFWVIFLSVEKNHAEEPVLDPRVLRNRPFLTVAGATLLSFFAQMGIMMYFPMFLQGVQGISATKSGSLITPYSVLMNFIGIPVGFLLARSRHFKWMYILGFGMLTLDMFGVLFFSVETPTLWSVAVVTIAGISLGAMPTVNTTVVQNSVPKRHLGAAMGAIFFCILMGVAIAPAVLGSAMNAGYRKELHVSLPELRGKVDQATIDSLGNPRALLSKSAMDSLEASFNKQGSESQALFVPTVKAIRLSMLAGFRSVFWISAVTMLFSFLIITTIPETSMDSVEEEETSKAVAAAQNTAS